MTVNLATDIEDAGERLVQTVGPRLEEIEAEIKAVSDLGDKAIGTIRITAIDHVGVAVPDLELAVEGTYVPRARRDSIATLLGRLATTAAARPTRPCLAVPTHLSCRAPQERVVSAASRGEPPSWFRRRPKTEPSMQLRAAIRTPSR